MTPPTGRRMRLTDLARTGGRGTIALPILNGFNMGNQTLNLTIPMETFREISVVANEARIREVGGNLSDVAQRPLDKAHAKDLAHYILRGLLSSVRNRWIDEGRHIPDELNDFLADLGVGPYQALQPFTANMDCKPSELDVEYVDNAIVVHMHQAQRLRVVDGQHRRHAHEMLWVWLQRLMTDGIYPSTRANGLIVPEREDMHLTPEEAEIWSAVVTEARVHLTVDVTVHLGLTPTQERQLFHDLNNLGKKPPSSLSITYDQANPISIFTRDVLEKENRLGGLKIIDSGTKKSRERDEDSLYRDDLSSICSILFAGATNPAGILPAMVNKHYDYGRKFFEAVTTQPHFAEPGWHDKTLLAQTAMLKGIAQLVYTFHGSREENLPKRDALLDALQARRLDFSPTNQLWHAYFKTPEERSVEFPGLEEYITPDSARKSFATFDPARGSSTFQFTTNTRDVMRYIGDLIRWELRDLDLGVRPGLISLKEKLAEAAAAAAQATAA